MKTIWSHKWKSSSQPRKQRKYLYNAPFHKRQKLVSVMLSEKLKERFKRRSISLRKGDEVQIIKGSKAGARGKATEVDLNSLKVYVENQLRESVGGNKVPIAFEPSNLMIVDLNMDDKKRQDIIGRKVEKSKLTFKTTKKTEKKKEEENAHGAPEKTSSSKELEHKEKAK